MKALSVLGTTSQAGKSILTTAICRLLSRKGIRIAPFKGASIGQQAYLTEVGGQMSYAQALQAWAAGIAPAVEMNPLLLKPKGDSTFEMIVKGVKTETMSVNEFYRWAEAEGWAVVRQCLDQLAGEFDLLVCEGAGSTAEVHLKASDLANMRVARYLNAPTLLLVDSERGGALAHVVGTLELLEPIERALIRGLVINKWRGPEAVSRAAVSWLEDRTGIPVLGVIPWDAIACSHQGTLNLLKRHGKPAHPEVTVAVIRLPHLTGFADFDPLDAEPSVRVKYISPKQSLGYPDAVILPGSRTTLADLQVLQDSGMAQEILEYQAAGGTVLGISGGFQMLGEFVADPEGIEGVEGRFEGLSLLPMTTVITPQKVARQRSLTSTYPHVGLQVTGYELHRGHSKFSKTDEFKPLFEDRKLGVVDTYQSVWGTYLHGIFDSGPWRRTWLNRLRQQRGLKALPTGIPNYREQRETLLENLTDFIEQNLDMSQVLR
ncbi:MAG: cobyric acid synthase CobQ [Phormidium sp.]